jgi:predicted glutamine amidotransferase
MCIAILKTRDGVITDDILRNCFKNNPNGSGVAYVHDNQLYVVKGIFNVDEFVDTVHKAESLSDNGNILIHCRISTSGLIDTDNSHPHVVNDSTVLIHNGILDIDVPKNSKKSDTVLFIERYLKDLPVDFIYNKAILKLIEDRIGSNNKFIFLNTNGDYAIVNESAGHWSNGVWYSNNSYEDYGLFRYSNCNSYLDYEDEEYIHYYGMSRDEFLDVYLANNQHIIKGYEKRIEKLSSEELLELGSTPIINVDTDELRADDGWVDLNEFYLFELDDNLQDLYDWKYYQYDYDYTEDYNEQYV